MLGRRWGVRCGQEELLWAPVISQSKTWTLRCRPVRAQLTRDDEEKHPPCQDQIIGSPIILYPALPVCVPTWSWSDKSGLCKQLGEYVFLLGDTFTSAGGQTGKPAFWGLSVLWLVSEIEIKIRIFNVTIFSPRILSEDGGLVFQAGHNKNLTLKTSGNGKVLKI